MNQSNYQFGSENTRIAIVTGGAQGMGRAVSELLARNGVSVVINDVNKSAVETVAAELEELGLNVKPVAGDVTSSKDVDRLVNETIAEFGSVNILVNNAGVLRPTKVIDIEESEWDFVVGVNLKGTFLCSKAVLPYMQTQKWGRIVNFSSTAGKNVSTVGGAHYTSAKAGILGFTRHLAKESAGYGITVNSVCPGLIDTEMVNSTISEEKKQEYANSFPIKRLGQVREVADLVGFLVSDKAAYITGASIDINGGDLMI
ncbi:MAG: SDR family oxidoreductase [SAR202 cluster bacterium]|nr:SDR family oxidoreductase [SAR202 cluster bacterium]